MYIHEVDLHYKYSEDGGNTWLPVEFFISNKDGIDEYIADVKRSRGYPDSVGNLVYIYDDPAGTPVRKAIWARA